MESFLRAHATEALTLEVGAEDSNCRRWFPNLIAINIAANENAQVQADAYCLPFANDAFDVVVCTEVLEHTRSPELALRELRRVLRAGGKLMLSTPFAFPIHYAPGDYYRFTRFGLKHLLQDWQIESLNETTSDGAALATFFHHWLLKKKGLSWKPPKAMWWIVWRLVTRSYRNGNGRAETNGNSHMPAGYQVLAIKPFESNGENGRT